MSESIREQSRKELTTDRATLETLKTGALLRIADATEKLCADRYNLERRLKREQALSEHYCNHRDELERKNKALRGWITRLKKQVKESKK